MPNAAMEPDRSAVRRQSTEGRVRQARMDKEEIRSTYTRIAPTYDVWARLTESRARRIALRKAAVRDGESILEIATGTGLTFAELVRLNPTGQNVGIDLTPAMLARAQARLDRMKADPAHFSLQVGDAYDLAFADASFDLVVNSYLFDMLPESDFVALLTEFARVLKPHGRLVMTNMTVGERAINRIWDWIYRIHPPLIGGCRGVLVAPFVRQAGFAAVDRTYLSQWTFPSEILLCVKG